MMVFGSEDGWEMKSWRFSGRFVEAVGARTLQTLGLWSPLVLLLPATMHASARHCLATHAQDLLNSHP